MDIDSTEISFHYFRAIKKKPLNLRLVHLEEFCKQFANCHLTSRFPPCVTDHSPEENIQQLRSSSADR